MEGRTDPRWLDAAGREVEEHDRGLRYDLGVLLGRRRMIGLAGGAALAATLAACGVDAPAPAPAGGGPGEIPDETEGPFPANGRGRGASAAVNVLDDAGIVRSDIRASYGTSTTTAAGVPLTLRLTVSDAAAGRPLPGAAVYVWQCDREGRYSLYSPGVEQENYLRGVQIADDAGVVTFSSVFPACYPGRWPHIHFEVYDSERDATSSGTVRKTSQVALTREASEAVYATAGYEASVAQLARLSLETDSVFRDDGGARQLASMSGDAASGFTAELVVPV